MAAIDKIYGTFDEHRQFLDWVNDNRPELAEYFYPPTLEGVGPITNLPVWADKWLLENCTLPWVVARIKEQYSLA